MVRIAEEHRQRKRRGDYRVLRHLAAAVSAVTTAVRDTARAQADAIAPSARSPTGVRRLVSTMDDRLGTLIARSTPPRRNSGCWPPGCANSPPPTEWPHLLYQPHQPPERSTVKQAGRVAVCPRRQRRSPWLAAVEELLTRRHQQERRPVAHRC